jgi:AraC-like DNA-binding protein
MRVGDRLVQGKRGEALPTWPPLLANEGAGSRSQSHRHHAMHLVLCRSGALRVRVGSGRYSEPAAGVLTGPDVMHAIDATDARVLLVFIDPESQAGTALRAALTADVRLIDPGESSALLQQVEPAAVMGAQGAAWIARAVATLGAGPLTAAPPLHPRVRKLLRLLRDRPADADASLQALAALVGLSPSRLMHAFTASIGLPLRPYLAWLRVQRAASAIVQGVPLAQAAATAGFADAAHMTRTFKRMFGVAPSALRG